MATITFPADAPAPAYGARKMSQPKVLGSTFGSGYTQRVKFGLNQDLKKWTLEWKNISETHCDLIEDFFEARGGVEAFNFTAPGEADSSVFICSQWNKKCDYVNRSTITASFQEVAEP